MISQEHTFCMDKTMTVLERQQARFKWLLQQQQNNSVLTCSMPQFQGWLDQSLDDGDVVGTLPKYGDLSLAGAETVADRMEFAQAEVATTHDQSVSRTSSCQIGVSEAAKMEEEEEEEEEEKEKEGVVVVVLEVPGQDVALKDKVQSTHGRNNSNKRKAEFAAVEECEVKRITKEGEAESEIKEKTSTESSAEISKENQKASGIQKPEYIHVRARRGQATDSHSLAERARREKISKKMKCLQDLVPGCNKITGRAGMLDEIINYVQSLQRQVEFLSMKLAALNPSLEFNIGNLSGKQFPAYVASFPAATISPGITNLAQVQLSLLQQQATGSEQENLTNPNQASTSAFIPELCLDSSCFSQVQNLWDADLQNLHNVRFYHD